MNNQGLSRIEVMKEVESLKRSRLIASKELDGVEQLLRTATNVAALHLTQTQLALERIISSVDEELRRVMAK